ncbi:GNAT family N-acetyltransferase [Micrococcus sp. NPDC078436]|uniref:GNAT family N-acetyltransferase n=1 Tax=unclassified Micrococcus TaxID=2620948 RepID=UPI0029B0CE6E|nr:GNAT family N-acetyltransferase [Micrococcus sp. M4NT]MDX2340805.1 GNAT family N-acetyltransferase [Micrococcus sp. M4NT]
MPLRDVRPEDLDEFFVHQQDEDANQMSGIAPRSPADRGVFDHHWGTLLRDPRVQVHTIEHEGRAVGALICSEQDDAAELSFWTAQEFWGLGLTTSAVDEFLRGYPHRPVRAHVAEDNAGTVRVLSRRGFEVVGEEKVFSNARAAVITELVMELGAD